jgi:protein ImuA
MRAGAPSLHRLRRAAGIDNLLKLNEEPAAPLGVEAIDRALGGGLSLGALHDLSPAAPGLGAAAGFAALLALRSPREQPVLWVHMDFAAAEAGALYGPGLELLGLAMERLVSVRVPRPRDVLWAAEEALKSSAVAAVIAELTEDGAAADLTATRRLSLAARDGGSLGLLLRHRASARPSAAATRWEVTAAPSPSDGYGLGRTCFELHLVRNRRGPCGRWIVCWDIHERAFTPLSVGVVETARDRSARAPLAQAG